MRKVACPSQVILIPFRFMRGPSKSAPDCMRRGLLPANGSGRDFSRRSAFFAFGVRRAADKMFAVPELKVLLTRQQIAQKVREIGGQISRDFAGEAVIFVGVLKGAAIFLADLAREVQLE